jgi:hypothetical protein
MSGCQWKVETGRSIPIDSRSDGRRLMIVVLTNADEDFFFRKLN